MATKKNSKRTSIAKSKNEFPEELIDEVCQRLAGNLPVRRTLPDKGRLHIDRQLPFLCVYRQPPDRADAGTERLVQGEASYLIAPGRVGFRKDVFELVRQVVRTLSAEFGAFLIVEIWATPDGGKANDPAVPTVLPTFKLHAQPSAKLNRTVEALEKRLKRIKVLKQGVEVEIIRGGKDNHPPQLRPILKADEARELNCSVIGLAVPPVYRMPDSPAKYPLLFNALRRSLGLALRQAYYEFSRSCTTHRPAHFHSLGRKAVVKAVWEVDRQLAAIGNQFDYLLQLTPVNPSAAWKQFQRERFEKTPEFHYRPLPVDPAILKRELYKIRIERVEDPALHRLFQEKQEELDLKTTMLRDRDTKRFLPESLQLFGGVSDKLLTLAKDLLDKLPKKASGKSPGNMNATAFAEQAEKEFELYRNSHPEFAAKTRIADDINGLVVSRGKLLINSDLNLSPTRVRALMAHEVGTHLVTYYNGRAQKFQQLYSGLAGYEELQEGLAVLSEYLVGGLSDSRMRQLAARVVAVRSLTEGATFVETFRLLDRTFSFTQRLAYSITMRVYRGGGLTKDAVYLRGLVAILEYVQKGGDLNPLLVGKMAVDHIPIIKELQYRKVLNKAPIVPHYMQDPVCLERLENLRGAKKTVMDLVSNGKPMTGVTR